MKKLILFCLIISLSNASEGKITPQSFSLHLKDGQIDYSRMSHLQKDTIVTGFFTNDDVYLDIAVYYKSKNEIVIFRNLGNGFLDTLKKFPVTNPALKIEQYITQNHPIFLTPFPDLKIYYDDGSIEMIRNKKINSLSDEPETIAPLRDFTYDSKMFLYDFEFVKKWQSERNGQPYYDTPRGDIDNDGKNEFVHTFYPISPDTLQLYWPAHIVVFENYGDDMIRVDWDTTLEDHYCGNFGNDFVDLDRNGKKEFFCAARSHFSGVQTGVFECSGPGRYKFYAISDIMGFGQIWKIIPRDTMKMTTSKNAGFWVDFSSLEGKSTSNAHGFVYWQRGNYSYNLHSVNDGVGVFGVSALVYDMAVGDIDGDRQDEILLGDDQWETNFIHYLDSTGVQTNDGYQLKTIVPGARVSAGFMALKDLDGDNINEIISCGIAIGRGSLGVVKHTGSPGENQFTTMWWDTVGIIGAPNWGIDTGTIKNKFVVLYPAIGGAGVFYLANLMTFSRNGLYSFYKSSLTYIDSLFFYNPRFIDLDSDSRVNIIAQGGIGYPVRFYLYNYELSGLTYINPDPLVNFSDFHLYQNYPNPFNPNTRISFDLPEVSQIQIKVYDVVGKELVTLVNENRNKGRYSINFNGSGLPSGIYFYMLYANGNFKDSKKMILIK